jgi:quercetin dioxygenase-like cupin family protein
MTMTRGLLAIILAVGASASVAQAKGAQAPFVQIPATDLKWEEFYPGGPTESFVVGSKEAKHGPTVFFIKFKGGFDSGWHVHESEYTAVILSGTMLETSKGADAPKPLGAGSTYTQPTVVHRTQCTSTSECLVYIYEAGRFSFTPTTEDGKPLPPAGKPAK